jgi:hypothetical protein
MNSALCPFHWHENPRPSIFARDPYFQPKNLKRVDLKPMPLSSFTSPIPTTAESDRTNAIRGRG